MEILYILVAVVLGDFIGGLIVGFVRSYFYKQEKFTYKSKGNKALEIEAYFTYSSPEDKQEKLDNLNSLVNVLEKRDINL